MTRVHATKACPNELELARSLTIGASAELEAHLAACSACRDDWNATRRAIALAREVHAELPAAARREEVRTAVLASCPSPSRRARMRSTRVAVAIAIAAAAAAVLWFAIPGSEPAMPHGSVRAPATARFSTTMPPDEIVRLVDGQLKIEVTPLATGERFRVVVGDAEIEVRGTAFQVIARADRLVSVTVHRGRVDVRPATGAPTTLESGQVWRMAVAAQPPVPAPVVPRSPEPKVIVERPTVVRPPAPSIVAKPPTPSIPEPPPAPPPAEIAFNGAWDAMRQSNFSRAAALFARVLALEPDGALAEDAAFYRPVALARAKQRVEAIAAFRELLDGSMPSHHAGEASAMLGWLLVDERQFDEAARRFRAAIDDPNPAVKASARKGLDAITHR